DVEAAADGAVGSLDLVLHAQGVVEENEVEVRLAAGIGIAAACEARNQQADECDQETAQGQEEELFDDKPTARAFLGLQQELHSRPTNALEAHAVDQMDDDRHANERDGNEQEGRICKQLRNHGVYPKIRINHR